MYQYDNDLVRARLREVRKTLGYSMTAFCEVVGVSRNTLTRYEAGTLKPKLEIVSLIAANTGYSVDWILGLSRQSKIIKPAHFE